MVPPHELDSPEDSYDYPHAVGTVPDDAAVMTDDAGQQWLLATARAVPTGHYLWRRADDEHHFRTRSQIRSSAGLSIRQAMRAAAAETAQFIRLGN